MEFLKILLFILTSSHQMLSLNQYLMRTHILIIILCCSIITSYAQKDLARSTPQGIFIVLGEGLAKDFTYKISRRTTNDSEYKELASIQGPSTYQDFVSRLSDHAAQLEHLYPVSKLRAENYWNYYQNNSAIDSLMLQDVTLGYLGLGTAHLDTSVSIGERYQYRIEKVKLGQVYELIESIWTTYQITQPEVLATHLWAEYNGLDIRQKWLIEHRNGIQHFNVYRRDNLQGDFLKIPLQAKYNSRADSTFLWLTDTTISAYALYEYYLAPVDYFGNEGNPSTVLQQASFSDHDFPYLQKFDAVSGKDRTMKVTWLFEQKDFLRGLKIMRSMEYDSGYIQVAELSPSDTVYIDHVPLAMENYYYRIIMNGPQGISKQTVATMGHYEETEKPLPAIDVQAKGTRDGVQIFWKDLGRTNYGFYVKRRNTQVDSFVTISELITVETDRSYIYLDSSAGLRGDNYYEYFIQTVNDGYQLSDPSDTVRARPLLPTKIDMPTGFRLRKDLRHCYLFWDDQGKVNKNLWGYSLYRKRSDQDSAEIIAELIPSTQNHYQDTNIAPGFSYSYQLEARDYFGAVSPRTLPKEATWYAKTPLPPMQATVAKSKDGVMVRWGEVRQPGISKYHLYRYRPGLDPILIQKLEPSRLNYEDKAVGDDNLYFYYLTSVNAQGVESSKGKSVSIRI